MDELALLKRRSTFHRLHQRRNLDGREIREGIRHRVWQNDVVVVPDRPAGIDDTGNVDAAPWMEIADPHGFSATCTAACSMAIDFPDP